MKSNERKIKRILHEGNGSIWYELFEYLKTHKREAARAFFRYFLGNTRHEPKVFCLCKGNTGSKYLTHLLRANDLERCYHEKQPQLDRAGVQYFLNEKHERVLMGILLLTRANVYFEASNRLFALGPLLKSVFPNSRFIHLHREGKDSIRSGVNKILWPEVMEEATRLRYSSRLAGSPDASPFERTCWSWANMNDRILNDLEQMPDDDVLSLRFDDLIHGRLDELESFLGKRLMTRSIDPVNTKQDLKSDDAKVIGDFSEWPEEWKRTFVRVCGPTQRRLGYEVPEVEKQPTSE